MDLAAPWHRLRHARLPGVLRQAGLRPMVDDAGHGRGDGARDHHVVGSAEGDQQAAHARRALRPLLFPRAAAREQEEEPVLHGGVDALLRGRGRGRASG